MKSGWKQTKGYHSEPTILGQMDIKGQTLQKASFWVHPRGLQEKEVKVVSRGRKDPSLLTYPMTVGS